MFLLQSYLSELLLKLLYFLLKNHYFKENININFKYLLLKGIFSHLNRPSKIQMEKLSLKLEISKFLIHFVPVVWEIIKNEDFRYFLGR